MFLCLWLSYSVALKILAETVNISLSWEIYFAVVLYYIMMCSVVILKLPQTEWNFKTSTDWENILVLFANILLGFFLLKKSKSVFYNAH